MEEYAIEKAVHRMVFQWFEMFRAIHRFMYRLVNRNPNFNLWMSLISFGCVVWMLAIGAHGTAAYNAFAAALNFVTWFYLFRKKKRPRILWQKGNLPARTIHQHHQ